MKKPKFRTCGKEHALGGLPEFQSTEACGDKPTRAVRSSASADTERARELISPVDAPPKPKMGRPRTGYIKAEYNRKYSADKRKAVKLGISVPEYRALHTPYPVDENTTTK